MRRPAIICLLFFLHFAGISQRQHDIVKLRIDAQEYFNTYQFAKSLEAYLHLDSTIAGSFDYKYHIGTCYLNMGKPEEALSYLELCKASHYDLPNGYHYSLAKTYQLEGMVDSAIVFYEEYLRNIELKPKKKRKIEAPILREIEMCKRAKVFFANPIPETDILNIGEPVNSEYPEYASLLSADEEVLVFTSERPNTLGGGINRLDGSYYEDIYISIKHEGKWSEPIPIPGEINTEYHDASVSLSLDGHTLLFYRYGHDGKFGHNSGELYVSEFDGHKWLTPTHLPKPINSKFWESSACFSPEGDVIFFTSNRKGGKGGTDIFRSYKKKDGSWSNPVNLGTEINTEFDETSPFLHPDGKTLYFCSNGHNTMGGFDIFYTTYDDATEKWTKPVNMGYPINTTNDDVDFSISPNGRHLYFSDHRLNSIGDKDIYYVDVRKEEQDILIQKGSIKDKETGELILAEVEFKTDNGPSIVSIYNEEDHHKYTLVIRKGHRYELVIKAPGYKEVHKNIENQSIEGFDVLYEDILMEKL